MSNEVYSKAKVRLRKAWLGFMILLGIAFYVIIFLTAPLFISLFFICMGGVIAVIAAVNEFYRRVDILTSPYISSEKELKRREEQHPIISRFLKLVGK